ncbi:hypothetical protein IQ07DRAFT_178710 [Pyrenochaeta sp. DS3sAY3a]|nr:hypothetical protein IQ07DRAFT_178710 [Pyrenochaeta sp. DS3sAY3a]
MMRRIRVSWAPALLLVSAVAAGAGLDLHSANTGVNVKGKKIESLIVGIDRDQADSAVSLDVPAIEQVNRVDIGDIAAKIAQSGGIDASALIEEALQGQGNDQKIGQGEGKGPTNQIGGGGASPIDQILNSLDEQRQSGKNSSKPQGQGQVLSPGQNNGQSNGLDVAALFNETFQGSRAGQSENQNTKPIGTGDIFSSDIAGDIANQLAPHGQGSLPSDGQRGGNNIEIIQIKATLIIEPNGQQQETTIIEAAGTESQLATSSQTHQQAPPEAQQTPPPALTSATEAQLRTTAEGLNKTQSTGAALVESASALANATAVTVSAGGEPPEGAKAAAASASTSSSAVAINSATLTSGGLAATTTSAVGGAVTVKAGSSGGGNLTLAQVASSGATGSPVTVLAGSGSSTSTTGSAIAAGATSGSVTVLAGSTGSNSSAVAQATAIKSTVKVSAGGSGSVAAAAASSSSTTVSINTATLTKDALIGASTTTGAGAAVTVKAGSGGTASAAEQAANNGGCNCQCLCPANSFPMSAPPAQPFQLGSMDPAPGNTLQTVASAITISAGGEVPPGLQQASSSSTSVSIDSATLTTDGLLAGSTTSAAGAGVTMVASGNGAITAEAPATTSVGLQSQLAADAPPIPTAGGNTATLQQNRLPFDINTVDLQSRVTVNLGRRLAKPTEAKRRWW